MIAPPYQQIGMPARQHAKKKNLLVRLLVVYFNLFFIYIIKSEEKTIKHVDRYR